MNVQNIIKLLEAGYTKAEIEAMDLPEQAEPAAAQEVPAEPEKDIPAVPAEPEAAEPGKDAELEAVKQELQQTQKQLTALVKQMQQNNLRTASVNILPDDELQQKTDEAMAELIRPKIKKEGE